MASSLLINVVRRNIKYCYYSYSCRLLNTNQTLYKKSLYETERSKKLRFYLLDRYFEYLNKCQKILERRFPSAMRVYRVFMDGVKQFYSDFKQYMVIVRDLNMKNKTLNDLSRAELELYREMPKDLFKVAPVLFFGTLPFSNYFILPLTYYFPRQLLCKHFWNLQQKAEYNIIYLQKRLTHNRPIFRHLQLQLRNLKEHRLHRRWSHILGLLGSGVQPTPEQILDCKELFSGEPYNLMYLSGNHVNHLLKLHEVHYGFCRRQRLANRAMLIQTIDMAILAEGGVDSLSSDVLKNACFVRGLNPTMMKNEDMITWLNSWIKVSQQMDTESASLLLHCPILLGYNHPSNWRLLYAHK